MYDSEVISIRIIGSVSSELPCTIGRHKIDIKSLYVFIGNG